MKVLVINNGSSSIKYQLFNMDNNEVIAKGLVERIGLEQGRIKYKRYVNGKEEEIVKEFPIPDHKVGLNEVASLLTDEKVGVIKDKNEIDAVGHRTVHGGEEFSEPALIDEKVLEAMNNCIPLAPLHNPANLLGIEVAGNIFTNAKQVGVFDTAFHQTMPDYAFRYALPEKLYTEQHVRRYGFHGTSHLFVSREAATYLNKSIDDLNVITVHVGNGASVTAIKGGKSVDTSMGMTPLEGLIMGTRSGDIDPAIPHFLANNNGMDIEEINTMLNKESGMYGITGDSDLREIEDNFIAGGNEKADLAMKMYGYKIKKYIGSYYAVLGRVDAIIFTAGVGENSDIVREMACEGLDRLGITVDKEKNYPRGKGIREIQKDGSEVKVLVIPTDEELEIARQTVEVLKK